jgi:hypothetical protein
MNSAGVPRKEVYHIKEINGREKSLWTRIGNAFVNKDGSINVFMDVLPIDGKIQIRDPRPAKTKE